VRVFTPTEKKKKRLRWEWRRTEFVFPKRRQWFRLPDLVLRKKPPTALPEKILTRPVYFTFVGARSSTGADLEVVFPRRGHYTQEGFTLATRFPFSFLVKSRKVALERDLLVYPELLESDDFLELLPMITGEFLSFVRGRGSELYRIREHTPQDPGRFVDWKATAKTGSLKVREFTREDERRLRLVFDNPEPGRISAEAYDTRSHWRLHWPAISTAKTLTSLSTVQTMTAACICRTFCAISLPLNRTAAIPTFLTRCRSRRTST
jgi:hypothetical protein